MDIVIDTSSKIIVVGYRIYGSSSPESGKDDWIFRMNSDASTDSTFSDDGSFTTNVGSYWASNSRSANSEFIKDNGQILVIGQGGDYFTKKFMVYELSTDGVLMNAAMPVFFQKTNYNIANKVVRDNDGKFILAGSILHYSAGGSFGMLKIDSNNSIDTAFGTNGWITHTDQTATSSFGGINDLKVQPADNKIVIAGMTAANVVTIARYLNTTTTALHSDDFQVEHQVQVFPNPADDNLNIRIEDNSLLNEEYAIADLNGRILAKGVLNNPTSIINIEKLSKGMYFLIIAKGNLTEKFIKN
ncbi:T9SS type A sorting domain-containing protein [Flavobacterium sp. AS60]|uniref:T9SS type A sorting domain-containing protein n=1 Tax=Flavobacterium anseongense TaxID=2910677 RepID=UPI001F47A41B|nr:T9SS type A sorting domain-containing protein [Flavobacterium sp. AS60]MCF6130326.1 T9SS type A sorting domain-containing protein [Flavobacterium sp. AS60]